VCGGTPETGTDTGRTRRMAEMGYGQIAGDAGDNGTPVQLRKQPPAQRVES